jgi:hypothetical protein
MVVHGQWPPALGRQICATRQECVTGPVPASADDLNGVAGEPAPFWVAAARTVHRSEPAQREGNDPEMPRERIRSDERSTGRDRHPTGNPGDESAAHPPDPTHTPYNRPVTRLYGDQMPNLVQPDRPRRSRDGRPIDRPRLLRTTRDNRSQLPHPTSNHDHGITGRGQDRRTPGEDHRTDVRVIEVS